MKNVIFNYYIIKFFLIIFFIIDQYMFNYSNILLLLMILSYSIPIIYIYLYYSKNNSVSNIICNKNCRNIILISMLIMGFFTILYEINRNCNLSLILMLLLLLGIFGVILFNKDDPNHFVFAYIVFIAIIGFMINQVYTSNIRHYYILLFLLILQILFAILTINNFKGNIFYYEVGFILNFALFYFYLHIFNDSISPKQ
jgi:hypothetical protein